jgi:hypothetical protein
MDRDPHLHNLFFVLTMVDVLHAAQQMGFEIPFSLKDGALPLPHEHNFRIRFGWVLRISCLRLDI